MNDRPKIGAIAPWFGGKRTMAPLIVAELGPHRAYWEPFCGSMAVLFAKPPCPMETVNDLHGDLVNLAMVVASPRWKELYERLGRTFMAEPLFAGAKASISGDAPAPPADPKGVTDVHLDRAWRYWVVSWMGRNGMAGCRITDQGISVRYTTGGGSSGGRIRNAAESLPALHERLRGVVILSRDGIETLAKIADEPKVAIYVDPPYFQETRGTGRKNGSAGGSHYLFDFKADDHERLAETLARFRRARVIVSYYDDARLGHLYRGWTKRAVHRQKNLHAANRRGEGDCTAPEVLLINGPSRGESKGE